MKTVDSGSSVSEKWRSQQDSVLFRRGMNMASGDANFADVAHSLETVSRNKDRFTMLVAGVAAGQEPLSLLTVLYSEAQKKGKSLRDFVDLHLVDARQKLESREIKDKEYKFIIDEYFSTLPSVKGGLVQDADPKQYKIHPEIREFLQSVIDDPTKSEWDTCVQDLHNTGSVESYDCISYNNVSGHIPDILDQERVLVYFLTLLKKGGILITDSGYGGGETLKNLKTFSEVKERFDLIEVRPGIFQRMT